jgi:hypothetical protein
MMDKKEAESLFFCWFSTSGNKNFIEIKNREKNIFYFFNENNN